MNNSGDMRAHLDRFASLKVLIIGDAILDGYVYGSATRLCREAPAPVISVSRSSYAPGGAANAAHSTTGLIQRMQTERADAELAQR